MAAPRPNDPPVQRGHAKIVPLDQTRRYDFAACTNLLGSCRRATGRPHENTQSMSLMGVKRTCPIAVHMSAFDPKRTSERAFAHPSKRGRLSAAALLMNEDIAESLVEVIGRVRAVGRRCT